MCPLLQGAESICKAQAPAEDMIERQALANTVIRGPGTYLECYFEHCTFDTTDGWIDTIDCYFEDCWGFTPEMRHTRAVFQDCVPSFWDRLMDESFYRCIK